MFRLNEYSILRERERDFMLFTLNKEVITTATQTANKKLSKNVVIKILFCLVFHLMVQADGDDFEVGKTRDLNRTMFL